MEINININMNMRCLAATATSSKIILPILDKGFDTTDRLTAFVPYVSDAEQKEIDEALKNPECYEIVKTVTIEI